MTTFAKGATAPKHFRWMNQDMNSLSCSHIDKENLRTDSEVHCKAATPLYGVIDT